MLSKIIYKNKRSLGAYESQKSISGNAKRRYHHALIHKNLIIERGLQTLGRSMKRIINVSCWDFLLYDTYSSVILMVRKFFVNIKGPKNDKVLVWDKLASCDGATTNSYCKLQNYAYDEYLAHYNNNLKFWYYELTYY